MINVGKEFRKELNAIGDPREKLLFGRGFAKGFKLGCESAKENVTKAFEHLAKGTLSEYLEKLKGKAK